MPPFLNQPSDSIPLPIVGTDCLMVFRGTNFSKPFVISYTNFVRAVAAAISGGGQTLLLQTNGANNPIQTLLNLVEGSGMTITDNGAGSITFASTGGAQFITAISDTADIDLGVSGTTLSALLTTTGVSAGTYGDGTHVPQIVVDSKGRITGVTLVPITSGGAGTVTSVGVTAGTGISASVANPTTTPVITITNTAPDQTVALTAGTNIAISGTYPNFTISNTQSLAGYVPYTGASSSVDLGLFDITAAKLNTTAAAALATPATKFLVLDGSEVKTRTPSDVLSDIGAAPSTGVPYLCMQESYPVATNQTGILHVPSAGKIYVCNISSNSVSIINTSTGVVSTLSVTGAFQAFYISSINEVWITSNSLTTINRISVTLNTLLTAMTGATINGTDYVEVSNTSVLICNNNATGSISPVNPSTLTIGAAITTNVPANPQGMVLNTNSGSSQYNKIIISAGAGVAIFDPSINAISTTVTNPSSAVSSGSRIRYISSTNQYIIANFGASNILILDIASATTFSLNSTIRNIAGVLDVAVDETAGYAFTCLTGLTSAAVLFVSVIDLSTKKVVATLSTNVLSGSATTSGRIALDTTNKKFYVCGRSSNANVVTSIKYV